MKELFDQVSITCSRITTQSYSTSFSLGIRCLDKSLRDPICAIYGFVRFADEIVDTFHDHNKEKLLNEFKRDTYQAIEEKISLNPILHSFQKTVNTYSIDHSLIDQFLYSMEMDLTDREYDQENYETYILGSAEVVGLMCLKVFCGGDEEYYQELRPNAMKLGSAFQKINFLRDLRADYMGMGRTYFPNLNDMTEFNEDNKREIEADIEEDFRQGYEGIKKLPRSSRFGVYLAYVYYYSLFNKIKRTPSTHVMSTRIRIPNQRKFSLLCYTYVKHTLNLI
ncbi:phytoene/squalene synthase family protein [Fulvivirga sedimenti]|uniref:Phytoene/squalene synthase family protein n=1 Tax=Fulvivirga sedimenti TaxID=2879465 RepID=A0A9X1HLS0_9BACT|nr:phytoene/squalene synthase family protein [Fulvivirga sedimenti]MCA6073661.1 phytoene/squalene synthase family protein [Fulvivirga sedimenti]